MSNSKDLSRPDSMNIPAMGEWAASVHKEAEKANTREAWVLAAQAHVAHAESSVELCYTLILHEPRKDIHREAKRAFWQARRSAKKAAINDSRFSDHILLVGAKEHAKDAREFARVAQERAFEHS